MKLMHQYCDVRSFNWKGQYEKCIYMLPKIKFWCLKMLFFNRALKIYKEQELMWSWKYWCSRNALKLESLHVSSDIKWEAEHIFVFIGFSSDLQTRLQSEPVDIIDKKINCFSPVFCDNLNRLACSRTSMMAVNKYVKLNYMKRVSHPNEIRDQRFILDYTFWNLRKCAL